MRLTTISIQLAKRYVRYPMGVLEDVPIEVGDLFVLIDFEIRKMEDDKHNPNHSWEAFLSSPGAILI